jgi:hypothetical protein
MAFYPNINKLTEAEITQAIEAAFLGSKPIPDEAASGGIKLLIKTWATEIVTQMRVEVAGKLNPPRDGSDLAQSIQALPTLQEKTIYLSQIVGAPYWPFIEYGVSGWDNAVGKINPNIGRGYQFSEKNKKHNKQTHAQAVRGWIPKTGYTKPENQKDKNGKLIKYTYDSWAFVIARNIKKRGLKPKPFAYVGVSNKNVERLSAALLELTKVQYQIVFRHPNKNKNGNTN